MLYYVVELQQKPSKNIIRPKKITGEEIVFKGLMLIDSKVTSDESQPRMRMQSIKYSSNKTRKTQNDRLNIVC